MVRRLFLEDDNNSKRLSGNVKQQFNNVPSFWEDETDDFEGNVLHEDEQFDDLTGIVRLDMPGFTSWEGEGSVES